MKFLIVNFFDPPFLESLYAQSPELKFQPYAYSTNLRLLGHEAYDVIGNSENLQKAWARDNGAKYSRVAEENAPVQSSLMNGARWAATHTPLRLLKPLMRIARGSRPFKGWMYQILASQIEAIKPDVLLNIAMGFMDGRFMAQMKRHIGLLVGQFAWQIGPAENYRMYDLFISSLPNFVANFRAAGIPAHQVKLGFEPRILSHLHEQPKTLDVAFIGNVSSAHKNGTQILEQVCRTCPLRVWGYGIEELGMDSPLRKCHMGAVFGIEAFQTLKNAKIVLNRHADFAGQYANNLRMYEATGVGSLLLTDAKVNLQEIFEPDKEVVSYGSAEECVAKIKYYLQHPEERQAIARAGQARTLREHTYQQRMRELVSIVSKYMA
jgi:hypothetical protein